MMGKVLNAVGIPKQSLTHCAFANGPGAFTGIRIAAASIQGISMGLNIPVVQISTLATLAQTCFDRYPVDSALVALDARMEEVYWANYSRDEKGLATLVGEEKLSKLDEVVFNPVPALGAGHGWSVDPGNWLAKLDPVVIKVDADLLPDARSLLKLAEQAANRGQLVIAEHTSITRLQKNPGADD